MVWRTAWSSSMTRTVKVISGSLLEDHDEGFGLLTAPVSWCG